MVNNPTEHFIKDYLKNIYGKLVTYMKNQMSLDTRFIQDGEALSEPFGYWLQYALEKKDSLLFREGYKLLIDNYIEEDGFIHGKIYGSEGKFVPVNSLDDDFRIINSLFKAGKMWRDTRYLSTAERISGYLTAHNKREDLLVDFYNKKTRLYSNVLTLSSIDPLALKEMKTNGVIDLKTYIKMIDILDRIPKQNGFYAKAYDIKEKRFVFESGINMMDQALIALHRAEDGAPPDSFFSFIKQEFNQNGVIYRMYKMNSKLPSARDESPALYGFSILYCLKIGKVDFAHSLYKRMIHFREDDPSSPNYGGYSIHPDGDTNILESLIPLLAEEKLSRYQLIIK